jgi:hypothetical protein
MGEKKGLGCGGECSALNRTVQDFIAMGAPRFALAKAMGIPLAPYIQTISATFDTTEVQVIPSKSFPTKVVQDMLVEAIIIRTTVDRPRPSVFFPQSDFFDQYQDGIEADLVVQGAPRYLVADFTPLSNLADLVNSRWPNGWLLTYQQQVMMSFQSRFQLPESPMTVKVTFRSWTTTGEMFELMRTEEAIDRLRKCGYELPDCYTSSCK